MNVVYLLKSINTSKTYIGCTSDLSRRLRQHNREIVGGARKTGRDHPWKIVGYVHGFESRKQAEQFEWAWQHVRKSRYTKTLLQNKRLQGKIGSVKNRISGVNVLLKVFGNLNVTIIK